MKSRIRLAECLAGSGYHSSIITTFGIDFDAYENLALPRLRGGGCHNNLLLADARMLTYALDGASVLPKSAGREYSVTGIAVQRVFHPKIVLQVGRSAARLIVSSANMTAPGMGGNLELAGQIVVNLADGGERQIIAAAFQYLRGHLNTQSEAVSHQLDWLQRRSRWLSETESAAGAITLADGSAAAFLATGTRIGIGERFVSLVGTQKVKRLVVLSPYWDNDLRALRSLVEQLSPKEIVILIDRTKALFPSKALKHLPKAKVLDLHDHARPSFLHAKAIGVQTTGADHLLYGSANCTVAALGRTGFSGTNEEACLYRRLPAGKAIEVLELDDALATLESIDPTSIPPIRKDESIPLDAAATRTPGRFELQFDVLHWWPPASLVDGAPQIELMDTYGRFLSVDLTLLTANTATGSQLYRLLSNAPPPAFARLRFADGHVSAPAVISIVQEIHANVREIKGKKSETAARRLSDEVDEGLWILEALETLESADAEHPSDAERRSGTGRGRHSKPDPVESFQTLPYEAFVADSRLRSDGFSAARNELAGSGLSLVQACLNRILGMGDARSDTSQQRDSAAVMRAFDLGDETDNATTAIENGAEFQANVSTPAIPSEDNPSPLCSGNEPVLTGARFVKAIHQHLKRVWERARENRVSSFEVLRLRAVLMVVAAASVGATASEMLPPKSSGSKQASLQLLPVDGEHSWPQLMCQLLYSFFGGSSPVIKRLQIRHIHDQIPTDILECWATCIWAVHACRLTVSAHPSLGDLAGRLIPFTEKMYQHIDLTSEQLSSVTFLRVVEALNSRFAPRLGFDSAHLLAQHEAGARRNRAVPAQASVKRTG